MLRTPSALNLEAAKFVHSHVYSRLFGLLNQFMSQHRSLRAASTSGAKRNVLKRFERVALLKKRSQWKAGDRVTGLRKTKPEA